MLITTQTAKEQEERTDANRQMLSMHMQRFIRQSFDEAVLSGEAESWITIAEDEDFFDLAIEMKQDLSFELETA